MANLDVIGAFCSAENCQVKSIWAWEGGTANAAYYLLFSFCSLFFLLQSCVGKGERERSAGVLGVGMVCTGSFRTAFFGCVFFLLLS